MQTKLGDSKRYFSSKDYDVDCFELVETGFCLFVYLKNQNLNWDELKLKISAQFSLGEVKVILGALKTKIKSMPIPAALPVEAKEMWIRHLGLSFKLDTENALNPGIFLDQSENRIQIKKYFQDKNSFRFLNLFSYTGVFSVWAKSLGAITTSVDVSARYLKLEKENQNKNGFSTDIRFIKEDVRKFLKKDIKRASVYDCIVLDPPTFSRSEGKIFKIRDELFEISEQCLKVLNKNGLLLISTNDADWDERDFDSKAKNFAKEFGLKIELGKQPKEYSEITTKYALKSRFFIK